MPSRSCWSSWRNWRLICPSCASSISILCWPTRAASSPSMLGSRWLPSRRRAAVRRAILASPSGPIPRNGNAAPSCATKRRFSSGRCVRKTSRCMVPSSPPSRTRIDYARAMAFIAIEESSGKMLGVVRLHADANYERGEYAILVRSDLKGRGLGYLLMQMIIDYARAEGLKVIEGQVLGEKHRDAGDVQRARVLRFTRSERSRYLQREACYFCHWLEDLRPSRHERPQLLRVSGTPAPEFACASAPWSSRCRARLPRSRSCRARP